MTDQKTRKYNRLFGPPWRFPLAWAAKHIFTPFALFQFWDEVRPKDLDPANLYFFHPVAFVEHLGRLDVNPIFPLKNCINFKRNFGVQRGNGRYHAGCDLIANVGSPILAVMDGEIKEYKDFYWQTYEIVIDHYDFIARYGEVQPPNQNPYGVNSAPEQLCLGLSQGLGIGSFVKRGQVVGYVGQLRKPTSNGFKNHYETMLHFELYEKNVSGKYCDLTNNTNWEDYLYVQPKKYLRRNDLRDPTEFLERAFKDKEKIS